MGSCACCTDVEGACSVGFGACLGFCTSQTLFCSTAFWSGFIGCYEASSGIYKSQKRLTGAQGL